MLPGMPFRTTTSTHAATADHHPLNNDPIQIHPHAIEHLLGGWGKRSLLCRREPTIHAQRGQRTAALRLQRREAENLVQIACDASALHPQPEPHPPGTSPMLPAPLSRA